MMIDYIISVIILGVCSFFQNMFFTWSSRSRNSGDPEYHRRVAWLSNGIWFITHFMILRQVWMILDVEKWWASFEGWGKLIIIGIVYVVCTAEGSVKMMRILLKNEKGLRKVGANEK